jgi:hypothetical protein
MKSLFGLSLAFLFTSQAYSATFTNQSAYQSTNTIFCDSLNDQEEQLKSADLSPFELKQIQDAYVNIAKKEGFIAKLQFSTPTTFKINLNKTVKKIGDQKIVTMTYYSPGVIGHCIDHSQDKGETHFKCQGSISLSLHGTLASICPYLEKYPRDDSGFQKAVENLIRDTITLR